jgi:hypothetical protein
MKYLRKKIKAIAYLFEGSKLDVYERKFIKTFSDRNNPNSSKKPIILIQTPIDYYYLAHATILISDIWKDNKCLIGLWPNVLAQKIKKHNVIKHYLVTRLKDYLDKMKWSKLYRSIGVGKIIRQNKANTLFFKIRSRFIARTIFKKLENKSDVMDLKIAGIYCGDLIYDTYLRFRVQPTLNIKDKFLINIINNAILGIFCMKRFFKENNVEALFSSYSSYIHHGIAVRVALGAGVEVYTDGNCTQYSKKLTKIDFFHAPNYADYKDVFIELNDKDRRIRKGMIALENKFSGHIGAEFSYMKQSVYTDNSQGEFERGIEGVMFLHDFFDSPHCYHWMVFNDFYCWAEHTLAFISKHKLKIAIKPHPNQLPESVAIVEIFMKKYPELYWIDSYVSNKKIFNSGISFGVSVYGSVLHELAYHNIIPIAVGDHPHVAYNFTYTARSIEEYDNLLTSATKLTLPENYKLEVEEFYYMHAVYVSDALKSRAREMNLKSLMHNRGSQGIADFSNIIQ